MEDRLKGLGAVADALQARNSAQFRRNSAQFSDVSPVADALQGKLDERTKTLEASAAHVAAFVSKAEKTIASKVSAEQLDELRVHYEAQLDEFRRLLQSQMATVRERAELNVAEMRKVRSEVDLLAFRSDVEPVRALAEESSARLDALLGELEQKAEEGDMNAQGLVEMRLQGQKPPGGGGGGGYSGDEGSPDGRFPPIAHPRALIGGHQIDTIATPRHYG